MHVGHIVNSTRKAAGPNIIVFTDQGYHHNGDHNGSTTIDILLDLQSPIWLFGQEKPTNCGTKAADVLANFLAGQL